MFVRAPGMRHIAVRTALMHTQLTAMQESVTVGAAVHGSEAANTFYSVKRLIGRSLAEVAADVAGLRYEVCGAEGAFEALPASAVFGNGTSGRCPPERKGDAGEADGGVRLRCPARGVLLRPEEVSAELLRHLLARAQAHLGTPVTNAASAQRCHFCATSAAP
jgi:molecular chaperone DnaK (HSP70)